MKIQKRTAGFLALCALLVFVAAGCAKKEASSVEVIEGADIIMKNDSNIEYIDYDPHGGEMPGAVEGMITPMGALNKMLMETDYEYESGDTKSVWHALYYVASNCAYMHMSVEQTGEYYKLPAEVVFEFADAVFAERVAIDESNIPEELSEKVIYESGTDSYLFKIAERGMSDYELYEYMENSDGSYDLTIRLYSVEDESTLAMGTYHMIENPDKMGKDGAVFQYSITDARFKTENP